jgi:hypothetical protein
MGHYIEALGHSRHHFWGEYAITIGLYFQTKVDRDLVAKTVLTEWENHDSPALRKEGIFGLVKFLSGDSVDPEVKKISEYTKTPERIQSLKYSVDVGEPFDVLIPVPFHAVAEAYGQQKLF